MATLNFNAANVVPDTGRGDPVPAGWYIVTVTESDIKPTSSGTGARLAVTVTIQEPEKWRGRKVFTGFNIKNDNPTAQDIAFKQLSALAHAVGVLQVEDSQQLHGIPLKVRIKETPASGQYEAGNDITAYRNMAEEVKLGPAKEQAPGAAAAPGGMQAPAGFAGGAAGGFPQQQAQQQPQQQYQQQQPVQQQPQQYQQQPQVQQQPQGSGQPWQQPQAAQPWANDPSQQAQVQQQQPVQQVQQQQPVQQQQVMQQQAPVQQQQQYVDPSQQQYQQQQAPVQQQPVQQQVQQQQPAAQDPAQVAQTATPPWMTQGQNAQ